MENKDCAISVIRMISMIMIISCHILQGLNNKWALWVNVGVQIFFFVSGYLYGKKTLNNYVEFYKKRVVKIMLPYIILLTIVLLLDIVLTKNIYAIKQIIGCYLGLGAFTANVPVLSHTWFISYILLCYLIVPILQMIFKEKKYKHSFLLFLLITSALLILEIYNVINIESSWINNFIFGYFYGKCCKQKKEKFVFTSFIIGLFIIVMPFAIIYQEHIQVALPGILNQCSNIIVNYGHVLLGSLMFLTLYQILRHIKIKENIILKYSDEYSYYIYLVHQIFILYSFSVLHVTKYLFINIILIFILSIISAFILKEITDFVYYFFNNSNMLKYKKELKQG